MKNYFSQKCPHCGNMMYVNSSIDKVKCLNCNKEFEINKEILEKLNEKQKEKSAEAIKRKEKNKIIDRIVYACLLVFLIVFLGIMITRDLGSNTIKISYSSHYFRNENLSLEETIKKLKKNGFSNIQYEAIYDIYFGIIIQERKVEKVIVNGLDVFVKGDEFPKDSKVIIYYHDYIKNANDDNGKLKGQAQDYYGTFIGNDKSVLIIGKDKSVYYCKGLIYDEDVVCYEENDRIMLYVKSLGYKIYFNKQLRYDNDFIVESTNENWNNEKFVKISNRIDYTKNEMNKIITSSTALKRMQAETVYKELQLDGYTNVILEPNYDVIMGFLAAAGEVERISINGETQFDSYLDYPRDSIIKIYYHEDVSKEPTEASIVE